MYLNLVPSANHVRVSSYSYEFEIMASSRVSLQSVLIVVDGKSKLNAATFATTMLAKWDTLDNMLMQSNCCKKAKLDVTILRTADVNVDNLPSSFYDADIVIIDVTGTTPCAYVCVCVRRRSLLVFSGREGEGSIFIFSPALSLNLSLPMQSKSID